MGFLNFIVSTYYKVANIIHKPSEIEISSNKINIPQYESENVAVNINLDTNKIYGPIDNYEIFNNDINSVHNIKKKKRKPIKKLYNLTADILRHERYLEQERICINKYNSERNVICYMCNKNITLYNDRPTYRGFDNYLCETCYIYYYNKFSSR